MTELPFDDLIARMVLRESGGNPNAVSPAGAAGLLQIMPATAAKPGFGVTPLPWADVFDPDANLAFGKDYMSAMIDRYGGDQRRAAVAYNWGVGNADKWDGDVASLPAETQGYLLSIFGGGPAPELTYGLSGMASQPGAPLAPPAAPLAFAPPAAPLRAPPPVSAQAAPAVPPAPTAMVTPLTADFVGLLNELQDAANRPRATRFPKGVRP